MRYLKWAKDLTLLAFVCAVLGFLFWPFLKNRPAGRPVPPFVSDEARRVENISGFSIIIPPRWECLRNSPETGLFAIPWSPVAARSRATMILSELAEAPSLAGFVRTEFKQSTAWECTEIVRKSTWDDPASSTYTLVIEQDGRWFQFGYSIADEMTELPTEIRSYIQTIQLPDISESPLE